MFGAISHDQTSFGKKADVLSKLAYIKHRHHELMTALFSAMKSFSDLNRPGFCEGFLV